MTASPFGNLSATNLLAFVDHISEEELVRKHIKDGEGKQRQKFFVPLDFDFSA